MKFGNQKMHIKTDTVTSRYELSSASDSLSSFIRSPIKLTHPDFDYFQPFSEVTSQYFIPISVLVACFLGIFCLLGIISHLMQCMTHVDDNKSTIRVHFGLFFWAVRLGRTHRTGTSTERSTGPNHVGCPPPGGFRKSLGRHVILNVHSVHVFLPIPGLFPPLWAFCLQHQLGPFQMLCSTQSET